jgi:hypothetical protein
MEGARIYKSGERGSEGKMNLKKKRQRKKKKEELEFFRLNG